jgi:DNA processing protein
MDNSENIEHIKKLLRLHLTDQVGPTTFTKLLDYFDTIDEVLDATAGQLSSVPGIGQKTAQRIVASRDTIDVDAEIAQAEKMGVHIISRECEEYPAPLLKISDAPPILYVKGKISRSDGLAVAMVGSRHCSPYGQEQASRLSHLLAAAGFTIVSGLARGVDAAAHRGALAAKGRTIAVQGCGLAQIYPPENKDLASQIAKSGAVVSELPLNFAPLSQMFPARNRIISGLSLGTIVVEARLRSGALITAKEAMEQNREVMAIPGRVDAPGSGGPHQLIKDGAQLVENVEDVMDALGQIGDLLKVHTRKATSRAEGAHEADLFTLPEDKPQLKLTDIESTIMGDLEKDPINVDEIVSRTGRSVGEINAALTLLQLKGLVKQLPGSYYQQR